MGWIPWAGGVYLRSESMGAFVHWFPVDDDPPGG